MILENEIRISAPPSKVWRILCEFDGYDRWHPSRRLTGQATAGAEVVVQMEIGQSRQRRLRARLAVVTPNQELAFDYVTFLSRSRETFLLEQSGGGTVLRHRIKLAGLAALLLSMERFRKGLLSTYAATDRALQKYAASSTPAQARVQKHLRLRRRR